MLNSSALGTPSLDVEQYKYVLRPLQQGAEYRLNYRIIP
jgi:hypothetical protein